MESLIPLRAAVAAETTRAEAAEAVLAAEIAALSGGLVGNAQLAYDMLGWVMPELYGAVGSRTTDDSAAFASMFADSTKFPTLGENRGAKIVFPGKTYRLDSGMSTLKSGLHMLGMGGLGAWPKVNGYGPTNFLVGAGAIGLSIGSTSSLNFGVRLENMSFLPYLGKLAGATTFSNGATVTCQSSGLNATDLAGFPSSGEAWIQDGAKLMRFSYTGKTQYTLTNITIISESPSSGQSYGSGSPVTVKAAGGVKAIVSNQEFRGLNCSMFNAQDISAYGIFVDGSTAAGISQYGQGNFVSVNGCYIGIHEKASSMVWNQEVVDTSLNAATAAAGTIGHLCENPRQGWTLNQPRVHGADTLISINDDGISPTSSAAKQPKINDPRLEKWLTQGIYAQNLNALTIDSGAISNSSAGQVGTCVVIGPNVINSRWTNAPFILVGGSLERLTIDSSSQFAVDWAGTGSPETVYAGGPGSTFRRLDDTTALYVKQSGTAKTGWTTLFPSVGAASALVQDNVAAGAWDASAATTHTVTFTKATSLGDSVLLAVASDNTTKVNSISDSRGNTWAVDGTSNNVQSTGASVCRCYITTPHKVGDTLTLTFSASTSNGSAVASEWSALPETSVVDQTKANDGTSTTPSSGATGTRADANELMFAAVAYSNATDATAGSGFTLLTTGDSGSTSHRHVSPEYQYFTSTGTQQATYTSPSTGFNIIAVTYHLDTDPLSEADLYLGHLAAAPTTGLHYIGEYFHYSSPVASGFIGEVNTATATPGTWKPYGAISA